MTNSKPVLLLADNQNDNYISRIRTGVTQAARSASFAILLENLHASKRSIDDVLDEADYAGIVVTSPLSDDRHVLLRIEERRIPFVRVAPLLDLERGDSVSMDEFDAASAITRLLIGKGHRRIAIARGPRKHLVSMRRYNGYVNALGSKRIRLDPSLVVEGDFTRQSGAEVAKKLFSARPTAIFASNDAMAAGIIDAAHSEGMAVPGDISVVGYDDDPVAASTRPGLTTVRQPLEKMGETAGQLLLERMRFPAKSTQSLTIPFEIVERGSVAEALAVEETPTVSASYRPTA